MINTALLDENTISTIESFTKTTQAHSKTNKNGNSLRMGLELKMLKIVGMQEFEKRYSYISERIEEILQNIKVKKH